MNSDQALCGQLIASNHTRAVRGSASWSKADARRALSAMLTVSRGLDILDAEANPLLTELAFTKLNGRFGANHLIGREVAVRLSGTGQLRSEEHTSELQSLMRISYAVFCLQKKKCSKQILTLVTNVGTNVQLKLIDQSNQHTKYTICTH